jgi:hypothetical protein
MNPGPIIPGPKVSRLRGSGSDCAEAELVATASSSAMVERRKTEHGADVMENSFTFQASDAPPRERSKSLKT